jgi:hypothetical protein
MEDKELLHELHSAVVKSLLEKIQNGTATAGELGVARQFLKDNNIDVSTKHSEPILRLSEVLPFDPAMDDLNEECA